MLFQRYVYCLEKAPLLTKGLTSGLIGMFLNRFHCILCSSFLGGFGDVVAQRMTSSEFDMKRLSILFVD
jgi:hypothetical protein